MDRLLALAATIALLAAFACGGNSHSSNPTAVPATASGTDNASSKPPALVVSAGATSMNAALGSYCWNQPDRARCPSAVSVITPRTPFVANGASSIQGELPGSKISSVQVEASPITGSNGAVVGEDAIEWAFSEVSYELFATVTDGKIAIDVSGLQPGQYIIAVSLEVAGRGDATYGFLLSNG